MILATIAAAFRRLTGRPGPPPPTGLRPAAEIRKLLAVERVRADRTGEPLSVLVFTPRAEEFAAATRAFLEKTLPTRLRITDEAGWLDDRICAVLPFTTPTGAAKVADDVCLLFPEDIPPPICTVYSYPSGNIPAARGGVIGNGEGTTNPARPQTPAPAAPGSLQPAFAPLDVFLRPVSIWKRTLDVAGATAGILVLLPLVPIIALAIKLNSRGPVFFKQRRSGWGGRPFWMWKFRTMVTDAEARKADLMARNEQDGPAFKIKRDPRVTAVGRILRGFSIDELPQLWNVLKGDMSLVGPRPLPCDETARCEPWHRRRLDVMPGLTCIWQVRGRSSVAFADWVRMDVEYIENQSVWADLKLILLTVPAMVLRKGAH